MTVVWTRHAADHLKAIHAYVAQTSNVYALRLVDQLTRRSQRLSRFPLSGRIVPEFRKPQIRELILDNYRVIYHVRPNRIEVLAVLHGAQKAKLK
jgi:toxin ParE1/3/4